MLWLVVRCVIGFIKGIILKFTFDYRLSPFRRQFNINTLLIEVIYSNNLVNTFHAFWCIAFTHNTNTIF